MGNNPLTSEPVRMVEMQKPRGEITEPFGEIKFILLDQGIVEAMGQF
jgi:hypothetical protein